MEDHVEHAEIVEFLMALEDFQWHNRRILKKIAETEQKSL